MLGTPMRADAIARFARPLIWVMILYVGISGIVIPLVLSEESYAQMVSLASEDYYQQELILRQSPVNNVLHRIFGIVLLTVGMMQFNQSLRQKHPTMHRWSGRIYLALGSVTLVTATILALRHAFNGVQEQVAVIVLNAAFVYFVTLGVIYARRGNFFAHRQNMLRSFAILMIIVLQRPYFIGAMMVSEIDVHRVFGLSGVLSLATSMLVAEWWIWKTRNPSRSEL
jgi:uncharacterized membrane protein